MMLDSAAEMPLGKTKIRCPEIFLAQTEIVVGVLANKPLGNGIRLESPAGKCTLPVVSASAGGGSP